MPGEPEEYVALSLEAEIPPGQAWADGTPVTDLDRRDVALLREYRETVIRHRRRDRTPQRTAMKLLRSFLSPAQRARLRADRTFLVETGAGNVYRLYPRIGHVEHVTRHGSRWFALRRFCLHDHGPVGERMPPADLSLAHLLHLTTDEPGFLAAANSRDCRDQLWNRDYRRRLREGRSVPPVSQGVSPRGT